RDSELAPIHRHIWDHKQIARLDCQHPLENRVALVGILWAVGPLFPEGLHVRLWIRHAASVEQRTEAPALTQPALLQLRLDVVNVVVGVDAKDEQSALAHLTPPVE